MGGGGRTRLPAGALLPRSDSRLSDWSKYEVYANEGSCRKDPRKAMQRSLESMQDGEQPCASSADNDSQVTTYCWKNVECHGVKKGEVQRASFPPFFY